jgi:hypothetical protein
MNVLKRMISLTGILALAMLPGRAQISNTLFFMQGVPQSNRVNPAYQPDCGFYLGFPMLAPLRAELSSSALAWEDVIYPHPTQDSLITFLHPLGDKEAFLTQLKGVNFLASGLGTTLSLGFRTGVGFFSLDVATRLDGHMYYPGDLARLMLYGTEEGRTYEFDGIGADLSAFDEISVGWSGALQDRLRIGARVKMMLGMANLSTIRSNLSVTTSQEAWTLRSDMLLKASLPFAEVYYDDGMIDSIATNSDFDDPKLRNMPRYMFNTSNLGFGLDVGVDWRPTDALQVSVSLSDLGYIRWSDEVHQVSYTTEYEYTGIELNPFELSEDYSMSDHLDSMVHQMADSLSGFLDMSPAEPYSKMLNAKLYAGASYRVTPGISFGVLSRTDFLNGKLAEQFTLSANFRAGRILHYTLSYSYLNAYYKNIGTGLSLNFGPLNFYLVSDNVLNTLIWPEESRSVNFWFGLNLVFGYREKLDLPLVE